MAMTYLPSTLININATEVLMKYLFAALFAVALVGCNGPIPDKYEQPCDQYESHVDRNLCNLQYQEG